MAAPVKLAQLRTVPTHVLGQFESADDGMHRLFERVRRAAQEEVPVLVRGETGSGKEPVARALHDLSPRARRPFVAVNCAALPSTLLEAELFGYERGAFTGAVRRHAGRFREAHGGTIFLDEIGEIPLELQAKLLRVLETGEIYALGAPRAERVDVRVVSATHRALRQEAAAGRFRADLMYRVRVVPLFLPPLRERPSDLALIVGQLLAEQNRQHRRQVRAIEPAALAVLRRHPWPGNVRELRNVLLYAHVMGDGDVLTRRQLPDDLIDASEPGLDLGGVTPDVAAHAAMVPGLSKTQRASAMLARCGGDHQKAATALGVSRVTLWRWLRAGIDV